MDVEEIRDEEYTTILPEGDGVNTRFIHAGRLRVGDFIIVKGQSCKVTTVRFSRAGQMGRPRVVGVYVDAASGACSCFAHVRDGAMEVPIVRTIVYTVVDIAKDGRLSLMDSADELREHLYLPLESHEAFSAAVRRDFEANGEASVVVTSVMGMDTIVPPASM